MTIPVPTYFMDDGDLKDLREAAYCVLANQDEGTEDCPRALACIKAINRELFKRDIPMSLILDPILNGPIFTRKPGLYLVGEDE